MSAVSLESGLGTISFDGQVLEVFGFGEQDSRRFHVGQIESIEVGGGAPAGGRFVLDAGPAAVGLNMAMKLSERDRAGLEALAEEVRRAKAAAG
jgi:hypothetical protein